MIIIPENWIRKPDKNGNGFLEAWLENDEAEFPIPVETHNVSVNDVTLNKEQDFEFIVEGTGDVEVYTDENVYYNRSTTKFASEAFVPSGLFSPDKDKDFVKIPQAIIGGRVIETYNPTEYGFEPDDIIFTLQSLGNEFNAIIYGKLLKIDKLEKGNYVFGTFWVEGWPREENEIK